MCNNEVLSFVVYVASVISVQRVIRQHVDAEKQFFQQDVLINRMLVSNTNKQKSSIVTVSGMVDENSHTLFVSLSLSLLFSPFLLSLSLSLTHTHTHTRARACPHDCFENQNHKRC